MPAVRELCDLADGGASRRIEPSHDGAWIRVHNGAVPSQGWKLHVSAGLTSADEVLRRVAPVLLAEKASFKVAASTEVLAELNADGRASLSQIGKFITVYPRDDAQAVRLAVALDEATRGLRGPDVPSDRPLASGSLVHYRYGGFDDTMTQTPIGEVVPAIRDLEGRLVPDRRFAVYSPPDWAVDPFVAAGVAGTDRMSRSLVAGRYLVVSALSASPRGEVCLAVDIKTPRRVVLKRAPRDASMDREGRDARERLRHERDVLDRLAPDARFPAVFDLFERDDDLFLVLEDVEGESIERHVMQLAIRGCNLPGARVIELGRELAAALGTVHASGFIYRDVKSPNVILAPDGDLHLVDFELAHEVGTTAAPFGRGTRGYASPQQTKGERPAVTDDVYGLGAILFFMASGAEPSLGPDPLAPLERPLGLLNPRIGPGLGRVIARCLAPRVADRFQSMDEVDAALVDAVEHASAPAPAFGVERADGAEPVARARSRELAHRLGDSICGAAVEAPHGRGLTWLSKHESERGMRLRDVNTGCAGTLLALAEIVAELGDEQHEETLAAGARALETWPDPPWEPLPGLYVGDAGVGVAVLRAGQVLGDETLVAAAAARGRSLAVLPHRSPDLFNGTAGRLRFHLFLWDATGEDEHLHDAVACGERLLETAQSVSSGEAGWPIPAGYDGLSGQAYLGYAHGAAGIADALLDLFEATEDLRFADTARAAGRWLSRLGVGVLEAESGLDWPTVEDGDLFGAFWCHGAAGIGRFFLHAERVDAFCGVRDEAARAARAVASGARSVGPTQCHGLAGNIEFLLDVFQETGDDAYLTDARSLAQLLETFGEERDGSLVFPSEAPGVFTPDYMVGFAGVAVCFLRLGDPESLPHQLSRAGFQRTKVAAGRMSR